MDPEDSVILRLKCNILFTGHCLMTGDLFWEACYNPYHFPMSKSIYTSNEMPSQ